MRRRKEVTYCHSKLHWLAKKIFMPVFAFWNLLKFKCLVWRKHSWEESFGTDNTYYCVIVSFATDSDTIWCEYASCIFYILIQNKLVSAAYIRSWGCDSIYRNIAFGCEMSPIPTRIKQDGPSNKDIPTNYWAYEFWKISAFQWKRISFAPYETD